MIELKAMLGLAMNREMLRITKSEKSETKDIAAPNTLRISELIPDVITNVMSCTPRRWREVKLWESTLESRFLDTFALLTPRK